MTASDLPNPEPRPEGELEELERIWRVPTGWRALSAVNNQTIGFYYLGTALFFFLFAGVLALMMRAQLAVPDNTLVDHDLFNQLFTMHGTVMMFLFAVPAVEAVAVLLLPSMLGARDLPVPAPLGLRFLGLRNRRHAVPLQPLLRPRAARRLVHVSAAVEHRVHARHLG